MAIATNLFILAVLLFLVCWDYPVDHPPRRLVHWLAQPFTYLGLWHSWAMFAPQPIHVNRRLRAAVTWSDGSVDIWRPLGPGKSALFNMLYVRSFKYECSLLSTAGELPLLALAEFLVATAVAGEEGRSVLRVDLWREASAVNPPASPEPLGPQKLIPLYHYDAIRRTGAVAGKSGAAPC
jgi:hypothetical protein